jgi:nucleoside-diphosphate-sugar epimerase
MIGAAVAAKLVEIGYKVVPFDIKTGDDLCDASAVAKAAEGCDAIAHIGAIADDVKGCEADVLASNAQGTWNILLAAVEHNIPRMIHFSSIQVLGFVKSYRRPRHFPVDDTYIPHPMTPYQIGKHLAEEACQAFSDRFGLEIISFRPGLVTNFEGAGRADTNRGGWDVEENMRDVLWMYVTLEDVVEAVVLGLTVSFSGYHRLLLSDTNNMTGLDSRALAAKHYPEIPWRIPADEWLANNPARSFMDTNATKKLLGWKPRNGG